MKKSMFVSLSTAILVGMLAGASVASTPGIYIDDQFDGPALNTSEWTDLSSNGGSAVVADGALTIKANGYGNAGCIMSVDAVHPDAGQTVLLTANVTFTTDSQWDWDKLFGFTSGNLWASGGAGIYFQKFDNSAGRQWHLMMNDGVNATQSYFLNNGGMSDWWYLTGPMKFSWSQTKVTWEKWDPWTNGGVWYTVFDSSTMAPIEGGTWRIPTTDAKFLANTWVNSMQLVMDSVKVEVVPAVPEPSSLLALGCGLTGIFAAIRRRK